MGTYFKAAWAHKKYKDIELPHFALKMAQWAWNLPQTKRERCGSNHKIEMRKELGGGGGEMPGIVEMKNREVMTLPGNH